MQQRFAEVLRQQREAAGLTQQELAELAGVSVRGVSDLERGLRRAPHPNTVRALARALALGEGAQTALFAAARRGGARVNWLPTTSDRGGLARDVFVGRTRELGTVRQLVGRSRLVTLTGPGGIGKTRLALEVAQGSVDRSAREVVVVDLAPIEDPRLVPRSVAAALGLSERSGRTSVDVLLDAVAWRQDLLIVLDNCEHLHQACVELVDRLLAGSRTLKILATSRHALGSQHETVWQVPPLSQPKRGAELAASDAVALLVMRVTAVLPDFELTPHNARAVADVCQQLDGLPLAIELAAAMAPWLGVEELAKRLTNQLQVLGGGRGASRSRHQTLKAALEWSYGLLTARERAVFEQLSVFSGGWTVDACESVCEAGDAIELLQALAQKSLVTLEAGTDGLEVRYGMLEVLRQYAAGRFVAQSERERIARRHADYYLGLAERAELGLNGQDQVRWLRRLEREHANLRAALRWSTECAEVDIAFRLAAALGPFWNMRGHLTEGRARLGAVLQLRTAKSSGQPAALRVAILASAARLAWLQGDYVAASAACDEAMHLSTGPTEALATARILSIMASIADDKGNPRQSRALIEKALEMRRQHGDRLGTSQSLNNLGNVLVDLGEFEAARECYVESLHIARDVGDLRLESFLLANLALLQIRLGEHGGVRAMLEECLALARNLSEPYLTANALANLGRLAQAEGDFNAASTFHREALTIRRQHGDRHGEVSALRNLGTLAVDRGQYLEAAAILREGLASARALGSPSLTLEIFDALGGVAAGCAAAERAFVLVAAGNQQRQTLGLRRPPAHQARLERWLAPARAALSADEVSRAVSAGEGLSFDEAVNVALQLTTRDAATAFRG